MKVVALLFVSNSGKRITGQILAIDGGVSPSLPVFYRASLHLGESNSIDTSLNEGTRHEHRRGTGYGCWGPSRVTPALWQQAADDTG